MTACVSTDVAPPGGLKVTTVGWVTSAPVPVVKDEVDVAEEFPAISCTPVMVTV